MKEITVTKFQADDESVFDTREECMKYDGLKNIKYVLAQSEFEPNLDVAANIVYELRAGLRSVLSEILDKDFGKYLQFEIKSDGATADIRHETLTRAELIVECNDSEILKWMDEYNTTSFCKTYPGTPKCIRIIIRL